MPRAHAPRLALSCLAAALVALACDADASKKEVVEAKVGADAEVDDVDAAAEGNGDAASVGVIAKAKLDLKSISMLVERGMVKSAPELEATINDPKKKFHSLDLDGDGKLDKVVVLEVRGETSSKFELKVIPSSAKDKEKADSAIAVAVIEFTTNEETAKIEVSVKYTDIVIHEHADDVIFVVDVELGDETIVVHDNTFVAWVYAPQRSVYVSVELEAYVEIDVHEEGCWPPGHCKHGHWKAYDGGGVSIHISSGPHYKVKHRKFKGPKGRGRGRKH
ncbi:MAG: hypothetical protein KC636_24855 [Myxococcales bacterium]|nr:hypothetical protein [Myxococcales bacterium]